LQLFVDPQLLFPATNTFLDLSDMYLIAVSIFVVNIWPPSLRTAAINNHSGQQGCGVRPCGLFD
jgi:hypothetical protein